MSHIDDDEDRTSDGYRTDENDRYDRAIVRRQKAEREKNHDQPECQHDIRERPPREAPALKYAYCCVVPPVEGVAGAGVAGSLDGAAGATGGFIG